MGLAAKVLAFLLLAGSAVALVGTWLFCIWAVVR